MTYGNGLSLGQGYDTQYRITSIAAGQVLNLTYSYDPNGNVISVVDGVNTAPGPGVEPFEVYSYLQGTNKLTHIETTPPIDFGYDLNANITSETGWTYVYDLSNQPYRVYQGTNLVAEYTHNGAGQRVKKVAGGTTKIFHYDLRGHLIAEANESGATLTEYVYLGDQLLAMIKPGNLAYYFHNDHLGTPQVLTDATGSVAWKAVYSPFGEAAITIETVQNPFRFPGQYYDQETGLHYNYFRYYNPQTGRYITPDPIGLEGGINLFAYVANNPVNWIDPWGLIRAVFNAGGHIWIPPTAGSFGLNFSSEWWGLSYYKNEYKGMSKEFVIGSLWDVGVSAGISGFSGCENGTERTLAFGLGKYLGFQFTFKGDKLDAITAGWGRGWSLPVTFTIPWNEFLSRF